MNRLPVLLLLDSSCRVAAEVCGRIVMGAFYETSHECGFGFECCDITQCCWNGTYRILVVGAAFTIMFIAICILARWFCAGGSQQPSEHRPRHSRPAHSRRPRTDDSGFRTVPVVLNEFDHLHSHGDPSAPNYDTVFEDKPPSYDDATAGSNDCVTSSNDCCTTSNDCGTSSNDCCD